MIRLVVFDLAGTTVEDPDGVGGALKSALTAANVAWEAESVNAIMGIPKPLAIRKLLSLANEEQSEARIADIHRDFQARMIEFYRREPAVREVEGATEVFREVRSRNIKVGLDTGFDRAIVNVLMDRMGWGADLIDVTATSDEVPRGRPFPDLILRLMDLANVSDSSEVAKVGDTPSDLQEGTAAGCGLVIGVTNGTHTREQLLPHPHTHLLDSIRDVPGLL